MHEIRSPSPRLRLSSTRAAGAAAAGTQSAVRHDSRPVAERGADADQLLVVDIETVPDESLLPPADD